MLRVDGQPFDFWKELKNNIDPNDPKQVEWLRKENTPKVCPMCGKEHENLNTTNHWELGKSGERYKDWCKDCWRYDFDGRDLTPEEVEQYAAYTEQQMEYNRGSSVWHNYYHHPDFGYGKAADKKEAQVKKFLEKKWENEKVEKAAAEKQAIYDESLNLIQAAGYEIEEIDQKMVNLVVMLLGRIKSAEEKTGTQDWRNIHCG